MDDIYGPRPPEQGIIPVAVEEEIPSPAAHLMIIVDPYCVLVRLKSVKKRRRGARLRHSGPSRHPRPGTP